jgi:hypothetical protein
MLYNMFWKRRLLPPPIGAFLKVIQQTEFGQLPDLTSQDEGSEVFDRKVP